MGLRRCPSVWPLGIVYQFLYFCAHHINDSWRQGRNLIMTWCLVWQVRSRDCSRHLSVHFSIREMTSHCENVTLIFVAFSVLPSPPPLSLSLFPQASNNYSSSIKHGRSNSSLFALFFNSTQSTWWRLLNDNEPSKREVRHWILYFKPLWPLHCSSATDRLGDLPSGLAVTITTSLATSRQNRAFTFT